MLFNTEGNAYCDVFARGLALYLLSSKLARAAGAGVVGELDRGGRSMAEKKEEPLENWR